MSTRRRAVSAVLTGPLQLSLPSLPLTMTGAQHKAARKLLGATRNQYADLIGRTPETVLNWETGAQPVPSEVALLLRLMRQYGITVLAVMSEVRS